MKRVEATDALPRAPQVVSSYRDRQARGRRADLAGRSAEDCVIRIYREGNVDLLERRWRGAGGEIDLVLRASDTYVFCEVKRAATFDQAMQRFLPSQAARICTAASEYLRHTPEGQLAPVRFDAAFVDGSG